MLPSTRDIKTGRVNVSENVVLVSTQLFVALAPKKVAESYYCRVFRGLRRVFLMSYSVDIVFLRISNPKHKYAYFGIKKN